MKDVSENCPVVIFELSALHMYVISMSFHIPPFPRTNIILVINYIIIIACSQIFPHRQRLKRPTAVYILITDKQLIVRRIRINRIRQIQLCIGSSQIFRSLAKGKILNLFTSIAKSTKRCLRIKNCSCQVKCFNLVKILLTCRQKIGFRINTKDLPYGCLVYNNLFQFREKWRGPSIFVGSLNILGEARLIQTQNRVFFVDFFNNLINFIKGFIELVHRRSYYLCICLGKYIKNQNNLYYRSDEVTRHKQNMLQQCDNVYKWKHILSLGLKQHNSIMFLLKKKNFKIKLNEIKQILFHQFHPQFIFGQCQTINDDAPPQNC